MASLQRRMRSVLESIGWATALFATPRRIDVLRIRLVQVLALLLAATTAHAVTSFEAEDALLESVTIGSDPTLGYSGTGYAVYLDQTTASIEWSVAVATPGSYLLSWTYRDEAQAHDLVPSINGQPLDPVDFPVTDVATTWSQRSVIVDLAAGTHNVRLSGDGIGGPAVDFLTVAPARYRINFSPGTTPAPAGWLRDQGLPFGLQADGLGYGWIDPTSGVPIDVSAGARNRDPSPDIDVFRETLTHMAHPDGTSPWATWELALPPGDYRVSIQAGDSVCDGDSPSAAVAAVLTNQVGSTPASACDSPRRRQPWRTG